MRLRDAVRSNNEPALHARLAEGPDQDELNSALGYAAEYGPDAMVPILIAAGANVDGQNEYGRTPLLWAALNGRLSTVNALLEAHAAVDMENEYGNTALILAARKGYLPIVTRLVQAGANVNHANKEGRTALMWTAKYGHADVATLLLQHGADPDIVNKEGYDALMLAAKQGKQATVDVLLQHAQEAATACPNIGQEMDSIHENTTTMREEINENEDRIDTLVTQTSLVQQPLQQQHGASSAASSTPRRSKRLRDRETVSGVVPRRWKRPRKG